MTHTPGPWSVYGASENVMGGPVAYEIIGVDGFPVAEAPLTCILPDYQERTGHPHWGRAEGETFIERRPEVALANAHLIAAAPELYEALEAASRDFHAERRHGSDWESCSYVGCRHDKGVLARARGEVAP